MSDEDSDNEKPEGFDISNLFGTHSVASMVAAVDGQPDRRLYRRFRMCHLSIRQLYHPQYQKYLHDLLHRYLRQLLEKTLMNRS